jgi:hypothetical protein
MRKFTKTDKGEQYITYGGVKYAFIVLKKKIGIRRVDEHIPEKKSIDYLTEYLISEGWADHILQDQDEETF